jgi:hypothetical protein
MAGGAILRISRNQDARQMEEHQEERLDQCFCMTALGKGAKAIRRVGERQEVG